MVSHQRGVAFGSSGHRTLAVGFDSRRPPRNVSAESPPVPAPREVSPLDRCTPDAPPAEARTPPVASPARRVAASQLDMDYAAAFRPIGLSSPAKPAAGRDDADPDDYMLRATLQRALNVGAEARVIGP